MLGAGVYVLDIPGTDGDAATAGDLDIASSAPIIGAGKGVTIIDGSALDRVFHVAREAATLELLQLTIRNGSDPYGGDLLNLGTVILDQVTITSSTAGDRGGGGFSSADTSHRIINGTISGNTVSDAGAGSTSSRPTPP